MEASSVRSELVWSQLFQRVFTEEFVWDWAERQNVDVKVAVDDQKSISQEWEALDIKFKIRIVLFQMINVADKYDRYLLLIWSNNEKWFIQMKDAFLCYNEQQHADVDHLLRPSQEVDGLWGCSLSAASHQ